MSRLVAVLGYSKGDGSALHPVCRARLARAAGETTADDVVLFSGWSRSPNAATEADLMAASWTAPARSRLVDRGARSTLGNALAVGRAARRLGADEVVVATSCWHARRAEVLVRAALRGSGARVTVAAAEDEAGARNRIRELAAWTLVPLLAVVAARTR